MCDGNNIKHLKITQRIDLKQRLIIQHGHDAILFGKNLGSFMITLLRS